MSKVVTVRDMRKIINDKSDTMVMVAVDSPSMPEICIKDEGDRVVMYIPMHCITKEDES